MTTINRGGARASGRLERELSAWLAGFEPVATPIALRLRTSADLRDQAERSSGRLAWLRPALSLAGSVLAIAGTAFAFMAVVVLANAVDQSGFAGIGANPAPEPPTSDGSYALISLIVAAAGVLAGLSLYLGFLRRSFVRLTFGGSTVAPGALLPLRRPWRAVGWPKVALVALTFVTAILAAQDALSWDMAPDQMTGLLLLLVSMAPLPLVIAWRYPLSDRPTRLMLTGAGLSWIYLWTGFALYRINDLWYRVDPRILELTVEYLLPMVALVALVTGLAARLNLRAGPPLAWAAVFVALGFLETRFGPMATGEVPSLLTQLLWVVEGLNQWFLCLAWLAAAWIGFAGLRRTRSRAWLIVLAAGVVGASGYAGVYVTSAGAFLDFGPAMDMWIWLTGRATDWYHLAMGLAQVGLLAALAVGLPPAPADAPAAGALAPDA